jgi:hypothetical protein
MWRPESVDGIPQMELTLALIVKGILSKVDDAYGKKIEILGPDIKSGLLLLSILPSHR